MSDGGGPFIGLSILSGFFSMIKLSLLQYLKHVNLFVIAFVVVCDCGASILYKNFMQHRLAFRLLDQTQRF